MSGRSTGRRPRRSSRSSLTRHRQAETSHPGRSSATPTCTHRSPWMREPSGPGSAPRDAYHFAKGEEVMASSGQPAKLARPLDFLVVADHSDAMGFFPQLFAGKPEMLADPTGRRWYNLIQSGRGAEAAIEIIGSFSQGTFPKAIHASARYADLTVRPGRRRSRRRTRRTIPGASPPSSATSGPRTPAATTCTAT